MRQTWRLKFDSLRIGSWWNTATSPSFTTAVSAASTTDKGSKSRGTFHLGRYYVKFGRNFPKERVVFADVGFRPKDNKGCTVSELSCETCLAELWSGPCPTGLPPDYEGLTYELPNGPCEKLAQELPSECNRSLVELLDPASMATATLERHAVYELDSDRPMSFSSQYPSMGSAGYYRFDKQEDCAPHEITHQAFAPVPIPVSLLRLQTDGPPNSIPGLVKADNSNTPSPVSPVTPSLITTRGAQVEQVVDVSPISARILQYEPGCSLSQQSGTNQFAPQYSSKGLPCPNTKSSFPSTQIGILLTGKPTSGRWKQDTHHDAHFTLSSSLPAHGIESHRHLSQEPTVYGFSGWGSGLHWNDMDPQFARTASADFASSWHQRPLSTTSAVDFSATHRLSNLIDLAAQMNNVNRPDECFGTHMTSARCNEDESILNLGPGEDGNAFRYPVERCNICGGEFTGKYGRGNLARHIRDKHGLRSMEGRVCRICGQVYNRPDARRKHEWKKHRMPDAKPNKRHKE